MSVGADRYSDWDAAYVFGSLSPAERREFELHLDECASCANAVAELAGMPGLLSKVSPAEAVQLLDETDATPSVPDTLLPRLVRSARGRRVRGLVIAAASAAAAAALAAVLIVPQVLPSAPQQQGSAEVSLSQVTPSPLRASIRLVPTSWGTRVEMTCHYGASGQPGYDPGTPASYSLYVTDAAGAASQIATWTAGPGQDAEPAGTTSLTPREIASVDVRSSATGEVLLKGSP